MSDIYEVSVEEFLNWGFFPSRLQKDSNGKWKIKDENKNNLIRSITESGWDESKTKIKPIVFFVNEKKEDELIAGHHRLEALAMIRDNDPETFNKIKKVMIGVTDMSREINEKKNKGNSIKSILTELVLSANGATGAKQNTRSIISSMNEKSKDLKSTLNAALKTHNATLSENNKDSLVLSYLYACVDPESGEASAPSNFSGWDWYCSNKKSVDVNECTSFLTTLRVSKENMSQITTRFNQICNFFAQLLKVSHSAFDIGEKYKVYKNKGYFLYTLMNIVDDTKWILANLVNGHATFQVKFKQTILDCLTTVEHAGMPVLASLGQQATISKNTHNLLANRIMADFVSQKVKKSKPKATTPSLKKRPVSERFKKTP